MYDQSSRQITNAICITLFLCDSYFHINLFKIDIYWNIGKLYNNIRKPELNVVIVFKSKIEIKLNVSDEDGEKG